MTEKKKMSVAEILAAARKGSSASPPSGEPEAAAPVAGQPAAEAAPVAEAPASKPAAKPATAGGARPSVADILAAARAAKGAGAAPAPVAEKPKPAPKPAAEKPAAKPAAAAAKPAGPVEKDTGSILAAARGEKKPGPITKAEAAAMGRPVAPAKDAPGAKPKLVAPPPPIKPDYAKRKDPKATTEERRTFFAATLGVFLGSSLAIGFTSLFLTSMAWLLGTARFMFPNILTEPPSTFKVGPPSDFPPGAVSDKFKAQFGVWVVNGEYNGQPQIYALRTVCTHLGCTPNWLEGEQKFKCPCHGSGFYKDGINFEGPAPRPLERYSIRLADDGQLEVSKSKTFQEEMGAWADPSCFVPV